MKRSVLTRLLSVLLAAMMLFAMPVQVLASESKTENPVLIEKGGDGKEPVVPGGGLIVNPGGGDGSGGKDPVIIIGGDPVLSVVAYLMTEVNGRPGVASQTVYKKGAAYTDVYVSPSLTWIPGSKQSVPDASEGHFEFLWVCVPEDASGLNEDNCPPVGVDRETWSAAVEAWREEAEGTDRTREDLLAQLYGARQDWTDDVRLPVLGDDAAYACLARWTRYEDGSAIYTFSANAVQVSQAPPTVLEEPWPLEDFQSCNDSVGSSMPYFNATARYGDAEIRYQWYKAEGRELNGVPMEGETNAALQPPKALAPSEEAWYYCAYSFVNDDGEEETHFSTVAKVAYNPASQFDLFTVPGWFYMGSNPGGRDNYMSWNSRQYCDLPSSERIPDDSADVYYQSVERESEISPRLHPISNLWYLPHSDRFTLQWYVNDSPALEGAQALGEALILTDLNVNKGSSYEFQRSLHDGTLVCPNEEAGEYYLIAVGRNYYTENGTEYVYEQTSCAKIVTFAQNEELYRISDAGEITNYRGHEREMRFPASVGGTAVTGISDQFRTGNFGPEKVVLPEGYKYTGEITFRDCVTLREAVLADSVEVIGAYAFRNSNLVSVNMPGNLRSIGDNAFENAPLTETACITLPAGTETVGGDAFRKTGIRELVLEGFPAIDDYAFYGCTALTKVTFPVLVSGVLGGAGTFSKCTRLGQVANHASIRDLDLADDFSNTPFRTNYGQDADPEVPFNFYDTLDNQGSPALIAEYYGDPAEAITVPGSFGDKPVVSVRPFSSAVLAALKTLTLPASLEVIPDYAFAGSDLESVNFAELVKLKQIGRASFRSCRYLSSPLVLREDTLVGMNAFESCYSLPSLQANGAWLAPGSFNYCFRLESFDQDFRPMNADGSAEEIRQYENFTFAPCYDSKNRWYSYRLSGEDFIEAERSEQVLRRSGHYWFSGTPESAMILMYDDPFEDELTYPGSLVFGGTEYHIRSLDYEVFTHEQAETFAVTLQEGIEETGFGGGSAPADPIHRIRTVTFPHSLRSLRESQFEDCDLLTSVTFHENLEAIPARAFLDCDALTTVDLSGAADLTAIGDQAFYSCDALEGVLLPERSSLQTVGERAFWNDEQLTAFDLSRAARLTSIGVQAFLGTGLTTLDLSASTGLEAIAEYAFCGTLHLERVLLPEGLTSIGRAAFSRDALGSSVSSNLARFAPISELALPSTLETVGAGAFWNCFLGEEGAEPIPVSLPDSLRVIENGAFASCPPILDVQAQKNYVNLLALASPRLPAALLTLGGYTGSGTVPGMQSGVFANSLVEELDLPAGLEKVGDHALYDLPPCTVTFRSKEESLPGISETALNGSRMTLCCYLGSAAYAWAMAYNASHERSVEIRLLEDGGMLSVQPLFRDGQPVPPDAIESIVWKDEEGQTVGSGLSIYDCALGRPYTAVFSLTAAWDWDYRLDRSQVTLEASEAAVAAEVYLIPRERITVRGRVACAYSAEAVTATLTLTSAKGAVRTLREELDPADPVFSFEDIPMCDMDLVADAVGHRSVGLVSVQMAADAQSVADLGEIELTEPAPRYVYTVVCKVNGEETLMDGEDFQYIVLNTASGAVLSPKLMDGSSIAFVPDSVQEGDVIRVSAQPKEDGEWTFLKPAEGELRVCAAEEAASVLVLDFEERERIKYTITDSYRNGGQVGVYAADGTLAAKITIPRNTAKTRDVMYISPGNYTLLGIQDNVQLGLLERLEQYGELGITTGLARYAVTVPASGAAYAEISIPNWRTVSPFGNDELEENLYASLSESDWIDHSGRKLVQLALNIPDAYDGIEKMITIKATKNMYYDSSTGVSVNDPNVEFSYEFVDHRLFIDYTENCSMDIILRTTANKAVFSFFALNSASSDASETISVLISLMESPPTPLASLKDIHFTPRNITTIQTPTTIREGQIQARLSASLLASRLEVYFDGELHAWSEVKNGGGQVPYLFPEKSGYHTVEVLARRADGEIVARQEPYRVYYIRTEGEPAEQPVGKRLDIALENGAASDWEGYHDVKASFDLSGAGTNKKKLYFAIYPGLLINPDGTFKRPVVYQFSLIFENPEAVDPEDVRLYFYRQNETYIGSLQLLFNRETGAYEGEKVFAPGTITAMDRIAFISYTAGTAEKDRLTPVMAPVELPDRQAGYEEDLAYVREQMENFAPVTDEALNWLFDQYYAEAGEELPPEVKADIRNYVYTVNNLLGEFYELFSRVCAQMTEEADLGSLTDKMTPIRTEPFGAEVTPAQLEAQGYSKALAEGSDACIYIYYGEGWTEIYDFSTMTHGVIDLRELPGEETGSLMAFTGTEFEEEATVTSVLKKTLDFISEWEPYVASAANTMSNVGDEVEDAFDAEFDTLITDLEKTAGQLKTAQQELDAAKKEWQNRRYIESVLESCFKNVPSDYSVLQRSVSDVYAESLAAMQDRDTAHVYDMLRRYQETEKEYNGLREKYAAALKDGKSRTVRVHAQLEKLAQKHPQLANAERGLLTKLSALNKWFSSASPAKAGRFVKALSFAGKRVSKGLAIVDMLVNINSIVGNLSVYNPEVTNYDMEVEYVDELFVKFQRRLERYDASEEWKEEKLDYVEDCAIELLTLMKRRMNTVTQMLGSELVGTISAMIGDITAFANVPKQVTLTTDSVSILGSVGAFALSFRLSDLDEEIQTWWRLYEESMLLEDEEEEDDDDDDGCIPDLNPNGMRIPLNSPVIHDPAGVVYEAVLSNVLEGATASVYYKDGDSEVLWDAENYNQDNPQLTDEYGEYMWMTPEGRWKVRVQLEGYLDGSSENDPRAEEGWLPVLPPQLNVNIPLVSKVLPTVLGAAAAEDGVTVTFSQYMETAQFDGGTLATLTVDGAETTAALSFTDAEQSPTQAGVYYVRTLLAMPADGSSRTGGRMCLKQGTGEWSMLVSGLNLTQTWDRLSSTLSSGHTRPDITGHRPPIAGHGRDSARISLALRKTGSSRFASSLPSLSPAQRSYSRRASSYVSRRVSRCRVSASTCVRCRGPKLLTRQR